MLFSELKNKKYSDLLEIESNLKKNILILNSHKISGVLKDFSLISKSKKNLARIKTLMNLLKNKKI